MRLAGRDSSTWPADLRIPHFSAKLFQDNIGIMNLARIELDGDGGRSRMNQASINAGLKHP